jgi:general stress protein 26
MSDEAEQIWNLMERFPHCTLATWTGSELRSRPMTAFVRRRNEAIYLLVDANTYTDAAIRAYPQVCLTFANPANEQMVSITGAAQMSADRSVIRELWSTSARQSWDSVDNPNICMLRVTPQEARLLEGTMMRIVPMGLRPSAKVGGGTTATL